MFFSRKKRSNVQSVIGSIPWDDETCGKLAESPHVNLKITSVTRTVTAGTHREGDLPTGKPISFEAHGIIIYPKYIVCELQFSSSNGGELGCFFYDSMDRVGGRERDQKVPLMRLHISDEKVAAELYESHRCALLSGKKHALLRVWKRVGEGRMTEVDKQHGYSYQSRYSIIGLTTWCALEAPGLPNWALPYTHERYSIRDIPESAYRMRLY